MLHQTMRSGWGRLAFGIAGAFIYALGVDLFIVPMGLYSGGLVGISQLIRSLVLMALDRQSLGFDFAGILYYALNIPLLLISYRSLGNVFLRNTIICATACSLFLSLIPIPAVPLVDNTLTSCLVGGVISGLGSGLALTCGCCLGGTDILALHLSKRGSRITVGQMNLAINVVLFSLCGLLFSVETMIYSILNSVFLNLAVDRAHQQSVTVQMLIFIKADSPQLDQFIMNHLHRGITRWEGKGAFTGEATHILCVCLSKYEIDDLRAELRKVDPHAFFIIQEGVHVSSNFERRLTQS